MFKSLLLLISLNSYASEFVTKNHPLMNRVQLFEALKQKFGTSSIDILRKNILKNSTIFYGPCDIYAQVYVAKKGQVDITNPRAECVNGLSENKIEINAKPNNLRQSWLLKTCIELVENRTTFNYYTKKYSNVAEGFYPYQKYTVEENDIKKKIVKLCISKDWQKL